MAVESKYFPSEKHIYLPTDVIQSTAFFPKTYE